MPQFDEQYYLDNNPKVAEAVARGDFTSGEDHFNKYGSGEGRAGFSPQPSANPTIDNSNINEFMGGMINSPSLPDGTNIDPVLVQNSEDQELGANDFQVDANSGGISSNSINTNIEAEGGVAADAGESSQWTAQTVDPNANVGVVDAATETMKGQFETLMDFEPGTYPDWAKGAVRDALQLMQSKGLTASTMMGEATALAIVQAALPIAEHDADVYANMNIQNIANKQAFLLGNQAATNLAAQTNAANKQQHDQFVANLKTNVSTFNAKQVDAMKQFNENNKLAVETFNSNLKNQREKFNVENRLAVEQSNAQWRRSINLANTAAENSANATDAQNLLNISNSAVSAQWQAYRDEAELAQQSAENELARNHALTLAAVERQTIFDQLDQQQQDDILGAVGAFAANVVGG